jgi:hypothetical protein
MEVNQAQIDGSIPVDALLFPDETLLAKPDVARGPGGDKSMDNISVLPASFVFE